MSTLNNSHSFFGLDRSWQKLFPKTAESCIFDQMLLKQEYIWSKYCVLMTTVFKTLIMYSSRMVYVGMTQNKVSCLFLLMYFKYICSFRGIFFLSGFRYKAVLYEFISIHSLILGFSCNLLAIRNFHQTSHYYLPCPPVRGCIFLCKP